MLSVIIPVSNEEKTIGAVLRQVERLRPKEIIVIVNGCRDHTLEVVRSHPVTCVVYPFVLGHDVGRAVGAGEASGEVLLFADGDIVVPAETLQSFANACYRGADIALNNANPFFRQSARLDAVAMATSYLNQMLSRPDLRCSSLSAVPHAMKQSAAAALGYESLMVPPKALAMAITNGLVVVQAESVNVFRRKPSPRIQELILGDHLEAIQYVQRVKKSDRMYFADQFRRRDVFPHVEKARFVSDRHVILPFGP
ncbi:glycosyltransferase [Brevibacillus thermoruber]|jgi:glycosyltransferase involved in cell wall biosynthesis|uniref:glycosyltransferase n=1 Tax=Brevibacillus thermoruber TaxID=33942 RepID=UPI00068BE8B0|nr:glycosyltransferase [Brevibacillus thermoruber]